MFRFMLVVCLAGGLVACSEGEDKVVVLAGASPANHPKGPVPPVNEPADPAEQPPAPPDNSSPSDEAESPDPSQTESPGNSPSSESPPTPNPPASQSPPAQQPPAPQDTQPQEEQQPTTPTNTPSDEATEDTQPPGPQTPPTQRQPAVPNDPQEDDLPDDSETVEKPAPPDSNPSGEPTTEPEQSGQQTPPAQQRPEAPNNPPPNLPAVPPIPKQPVAISAPPESDSVDESDTDARKTYSLEGVEPLSTPHTRITPTAEELPRSVLGAPIDLSKRWGMTAINAAAAHASIRSALGDNVRPGAGATIGVMDSGIEALHPVFEGRHVNEYVWSGATDSTTKTYNSAHGTVVASIAAATAPGADFESYAIPLGRSSSSRLFRPISEITLKLYTDRRWAARTNFILRQDIDALNLSLSLDGLIDDYESDSLRRSFATAIDSMAQAYRDPHDRVVLVWAGGNAYGRPCLAHHTDEHCDPVPQRPSGELCEKGSSWHCIEESENVYRFAATGDPCQQNSSPYCQYDYQTRDYRMQSGGTIRSTSVGLLPGLMAYYEELQGHSVAVVSVSQDPDNPDQPVISSYSNRCGIAKDYCIAAPGDRVALGTFQIEEEAMVFSYSNQFRGTSLAAPFVSGGLALVIHRFRGQVPPVDALQRLYATAKKTGIYANSDVYGQGLLDLEAAVAPVGSSSFASGSTVDGSGAGLRSTRLSLSPAFGAGAMRSISGREVAAFDSLGAPFWHDLGALTTSPRQQLSDQLKRMLAGDYGLGSSATLALASQNTGAIRMSLTTDAPGYIGIAGPALAMSWSDADSPLAVYAFTTEGTGGQTPATGMTFSWNPLGLSAGLIAESASALGAAAKGGFGQIAATSVFSRFNHSRKAGIWDVAGSVEFGVTDPSASNGILARMAPAPATGFTLGANREFGEAGLFQISLEQPLRVEKAQTTFWAPVGRTRAGKVLRQRWQTDLAPSGRQIDLSAWWSRPTSDVGTVRVGAVASRHPGHDSAAPPTLSLLAGYRVAF